MRDNTYWFIGWMTFMGLAFVLAITAILLIHNQAQIAKDILLFLTGLFGGVGTTVIIVKTVSPSN